MRDIIFLSIVCACTVIAIPRPVFGVMAFFSLSILNLHSMTWGPAKDFPFAVAVSIATLIGLVFWNEPKRLPKAPGMALFVVLWIAFGVTTLTADYPDLAFDKLIAVSKILLMTFVSMILINTEERLVLFLKVIALSMGLHGLKAGLWFVVSGGESTVYGPERSFLSANNAIGMALAMTVPMLYFLIGLEKKRWLRYVMWSMIVFSVPAIIGTYSRGAWLGLGMAMMLIIWQSRYRIPLAAIVAVVALVGVSFLPNRVDDRFDDLVNYHAEASAQQRLWSWRFASHVFAANPLTGAGFDYYSMEATGKYYPELWERWPGRHWSAHSSWFTILSEHGLIGSIPWLLLLLAAVRNCLYMRRLGKRPDAPEWLTPVSKMLLGALGAYAISGTFYDAAYFDYYYEIIALTIIGSCLVTRNATLRSGVTTPATTFGAPIRAS